MGMYTEFYLKVRLKKDTPKDIIEALVAMTQGIEQFPFHPAVYTEFEWHSENQCTITNYREFKNYHDEIKGFLEWLEPHIDTRPVTEGFLFVGWYRFEIDPNPTLIYLTDTGKITYLPITYEYYREINP